MSRSCVMGLHETYTMAGGRRRTRSFTVLGCIPAGRSTVLKGNNAGCKAAS